MSLLEAQVLEASGASAPVFVSHSRTVGWLTTVTSVTSGLHNP